MNDLTPEKPPIHITVIAIAYVICGLWYFSWRLTAINWHLPLFSIPLYGAELFGFVTGLLYLLMTYRLAVRAVPTPIRDATVDVFVPTYNESAELVRRTLQAAQNIRYPHRTWLLDDGHREEMLVLARELGCDYLARSENSHAKAGNLNNALEHSNGEFIAIFDADHAARKDFLDKTLGYFADPTVAFVQTPQDFYNVDSFNHRMGGRRVWNEQSLFFKVIQRGKDTWNATFFCGSCAVLRRSALEAIGGFATETVTEDIHTSIKLHKQGYRSVYQPESLAFGLAPHSIDTYLQQRIRWGMGGMQVLRREHILSSPGLTLAQRLNYLASMLIYFEGWQKLVFFITSPAVFFFGILPISAPMSEFLTYFLVYYALSSLMYTELARGYGALFLSEQYGMVRFFAFMLTTAGLFRKKIGFSVTSKELSLAGRAWLWLSPSLIVAGLTALSIPVGFYRMYHGTLPVSAGAANTVWACSTIATASVIAWFSYHRAQNRRTEYRFPLHIPMMLTLDGRSCLGLSEDLSASGALYHGEVPVWLSPKSSPEVEIHLPNLVIRTKASVTFVGGDRGIANSDRTIGLRFSWASADLSRPLETFLFGSSLQFEQGGVTDQRTTLLTRLARGTPTSTSVLGAGTHWAPGFLIRSRDAHPVPVAVVSAVRDTGDMWWILCNGEFDTSQEVFLRQRQAGSETTQRVSLGSSGSLDTPTGQMHLYNVTSRHSLTLQNLGNEDDENHAEQSSNTSPDSDRNRRLRPAI
ncbi:glycosyltransferase [Paraburkholderia madseniana]|uniref:glycosyltransferase family 2 protein n=1 Tax=Paraburkholderia madseniana TaxID=2599607 RepID=UPI0015C53B92|nr:glycosyltransferase [Paraburkholderia madseniana]NPT69012.1 glycosyltransferase [Paraburkholderia madseniana]